ncbi:MAG: YheU family protein [Steroidobacteraceae bacterium]
MVIPYTELSPDALQGVIESFVLREGTEYGASDYSLEQKVAHVMRQLERKEAHVVFDPDSQSVNIVVKDVARARF